MAAICNQEIAQLFFTLPQREPPKAKGGSLLVSKLRLFTFRLCKNDFCVYFVKLLFLIKLAPPTLRSNCATSRLGISTRTWIYLGKADTACMGCKAFGILGFFVCFLKTF